MKKYGINQGVAFPSKREQAFILPEGKKEPYHIMHRMFERGIRDDDIREYMTNAKCMFVQWQGKRRVYYSDKGVCVITKSDDDWIFKTAWTERDFDESTELIMEVINKYA